MGLPEAGPARCRRPWSPQQHELCGDSTTRLCTLEYCARWCVPVSRSPPASPRRAGGVHAVRSPLSASLARAYFVAGTTTSSAPVGPLKRPRAARTLGLLEVTTQYAWELGATRSVQPVPGGRVAGGKGQVEVPLGTGVPERMSNSCNVTVMGFVSRLVMKQIGTWSFWAGAPTVVRTVAAPASGALASTSANVASAAAP